MTDDERTEPHLANGAKLHMLGAGVAVLVGERGAEHSERVQGTVWCGFHNFETRLVFVPDEYGDGTHDFKVTGPVAWCAIFLGRDECFRSPIRAHRGHTVTMHWNAYEDMA